MIAFAGAATLLCAVVLTVLLRPLWPEMRGATIAIAAATSLALAILYRLVGTPEALHENSVNAPQTLDQAIELLKLEVKKNPREMDAWRLLGLAYQRADQAIAARDAYANAANIAINDADVLTEYAQSRALADEKRLFDMESVALLQRALRLKPEHLRARWFLGIAMRQRGRNAEAIALWEPLLGQVDSETAAVLRKEIGSASGAKPGSDTAAAGPAITVKVALDPSLANNARSDNNTVVFVIAREPGGHMPVAVERHLASDLPLTVVLDDGDSPMPTRPLSQLHEVELTARLSNSGIGNKQTGDIESTPVRVALPAEKPIELVIKKYR